MVTDDPSPAGGKVFPVFYKGEIWQVPRFLLWMMVDTTVQNSGRTKVFSEKMSTKILFTEKSLI